MTTDRKIMTLKFDIHLLRLIGIFVAALCSHNAFAEHALPEYKAQYAIQKFGIKLAEAHYQLNYTDTGYKFTEDTNLVGIASMFRSDTVSVVSYIDQVGDKLLLQKHSYKQTGEEKNKDEDFSIKWDTAGDKIRGKITGIVRSREISLETDTPIWEVLSFQIPLMIEANKDIKEYPYRALLDGEIDTYNFVLTSSKKISFAGKEYEILQFVRSDPERDRQLHIWLAPALHNMPMIVENYRDGKEHSRMQIESLQFNDEKPLIEQIADNDNDY
jgi:hypothetical protein